MAADQAPTVLVGVDGSDGANRAFRWALSCASASGAGVTAVHVLTFSAELARDVSLDTIRTWRRDLRHQLELEWAPAPADGTSVSWEVVESESAAAGVLAIATRDHVDLVVLGAHGRGSIRGRLLGSTTYRVSHAAHVPVVVVPANWPVETGVSGASVVPITRVER